MARYSIDYSCGHRGEIVLFGPTKNREWRIEKEKENICSDCYDQQLSEQSIIATQENATNGMPPLRGTEKQVLWAERIRNAAMRSFETIGITPQTSYRLRDASQEEIDLAVNAVMAKEKASWWIDNREAFSSSATIWFFAIVDVLVEEIEASIQKPVATAKAVADDAKVEATVYPEKPKTATIAEIRIKNDLLEVYFPEKREDFWAIIKKQLGFSWNGTCWQRTLIAKNGAPTDRAAEVGHVLLTTGFPVRIYDEVVRQKSITGDFVAEQTRWILCRKEGMEYAGWFAITWAKDDDLYAAAKRIPGSRWNNTSVVVPPEQYEQVLDFAERYEFAVSDNAQNVAQNAKAAKETALVVNVAVRQYTAPNLTNTPPNLATPGEVEIDEGLRDKD